MANPQYQQLLEARKLRDSGQISPDEYDKIYDSLYDERQQKLGKDAEAGFLQWKDRLPSAAMGATGGFLAGNVPGAVIGGTLGALFPPETMTEVAMSAIPGLGKFPGMGGAVSRLASKSPAMLQKAAQMAGKVMGSGGGKSGVLGQVARGALEGEAEMAATKIGNSLETGQGMPSPQEALVPQNIWEGLAVGGGAAARGGGAALGNRAGRSPGVMTDEMAGELGVNPRTVGAATSPTRAMTQNTTEQMQGEFPNRAALRQQAIDVEEELNNLKKRETQVKEEINRHQAAAKKDVIEAKTAYRNQQLEVAGHIKHYDEKIAASREKISGLIQNKRNLKKVREAEAVEEVMATPEMAAISERIKSKKQQLLDIKQELIQERAVGQELAAQSKSSPKGQDGMRRGGISPVTGDQVDPFTTQGEQFPKKQEVIAETRDKNQLKVEVEAEIAQLERSQKDAMALAVMQAQSEFVNNPDPQLKRALAERSRYKGHRTRQRNLKQELKQGENDLAVAGAEGQYNIKYESQMAQERLSLTDDIIEQQSAGYDLQRAMTKLEGDPNHLVRNFSWAQSDTEQWQQIFNKSNPAMGYETTQAVWNKFNAAEKKNFKTWFFQNMTRELMDNQRQLMSNYDAVFGKSGALDPRTLALVLDDVDAARDMTAWFAGISKGSKSFWDSNAFMKKTSGHLAFHASMAIIYMPSSILSGAMVGAPALVAVTWPRMLDAMSENPAMRKEMLRMLDDESGSLSAKLYPILAQWLVENGRGITAEENEEKEEIMAPVTVPQSQP